MSVDFMYSVQPNTDPQNVKKQKKNVILYSLEMFVHKDLH